MYETTKQLTLDLAAIPSINGTPGEATVIDFLHHYLTRQPIYHNGKMRVFLLTAENDPLNRPILVAHIPGHSKNQTGSKRGVLMFGHVDTVGTADYGKLEPLAMRPLELTEQVKLGALGPIAQARANTGRWLYGRGVLDMKSGVAAALTAFLARAEQMPEEDLLFAATPDEEAGALGIRTLATWLRHYLDSEHITLGAAINTDYTTRLPDDGGARHIYLGSIGKLLPAVYVRGVPSHAAEPEHGIDPNLLVAAITQQVVYNGALRDRDGEELCPHPVCLHQRDDKPVYNVQTAVSATAYYNLFHMQRSPKEQLALITEVVKTAVSNVQTLHPEMLSINIPVLTFAELWASVPTEIQAEIRAYSTSLPLSTDLRERCRLVVERLLQANGLEGACVVIYFANELVPKVNSGEAVHSELLATLTEFSQATGETFALHRYFPYISDLSYLTSSPDWNDPGFQQNFPLATAAESGTVLEVPTLMVGTYGTGAHQPDECVDMDYTFGRLPILLTKLSQQLGASSRSH